jgi:hypothetical protein
VEEAKQAMDESIPAILHLDNVHLTLALAEDYAAVLTDQGDLRTAGRLLGAADAWRERLRVPRSREQEREIAGIVARVRDALGETEWGSAYQIGRTFTLEEALAGNSDVLESSTSVAASL